MSLDQDLLDVQGASDDHMEALNADIAIITKRLSSGRSQELSLAMRRGCGEALHGLLQAMHLSAPSWFHAMALLDLYFHSEGIADRDDIPSLCTGIAIILGKFEGADTSLVHGFVQNEELMCQVYRKEAELLEILQFRIRCPTLCSWFNIFLPRLHLAIKEKRWYPFICQFSMHYLHAFVLKNVCIPDCKLQHIAQGLLAFALVKTAERFGFAIAHPRELPEDLRGNLLGCISADMNTLMSDFDMVEKSIS